MTRAKLQANIAVQKRQDVCNVSFIRTIPSVSESHRICTQKTLHARGLMVHNTHRRWGLTPRPETAEYIIDICYNFVNSIYCNNAIKYYHYC